MGSQIKDVAVSAAEELGRNGWLHNGSLEGAILKRATLANADLRGATLQCAELFHANIRGINFFLAKLEGADLRDATLFGVNFDNTRLKNAIYNSYTFGPEGFNLVAAGAILVESDDEEKGDEIVNSQEQNENH